LIPVQALTKNNSIIQIKNVQIKEFRTPVETDLNASRFKKEAYG